MTSAFARVIVHQSQWPEFLSQDLLQSLRSRQIQNKLHYDSHKQTGRWLALHEACSPARTDPDCEAVYDRAFGAAAAEPQSERMHLIGLGAGGGRKDARLVELLQAQGCAVDYSPVDSSVPMVLVARRTVLPLVTEARCHPLVCDLAKADDLASWFDQRCGPEQRRLLTFFGMIPNFEPQVILPRLASLVRPGDRLLFSANLAPGPDYGSGVRQILPQYDNPWTREWLMTFLTDLGIEAGDGALVFSIESCLHTPGLLRVEAGYRLLRQVTVTVEREPITFAAGERLRLFYSYRYTPEQIKSLLSRHGLKPAGAWITKSGEEGVFLLEGARA